MAKKAAAKSRRKSKAPAKKRKKAVRTRSRRRFAPMATAAAAAPAHPVIGQIADLAGASAIAQYFWKDRGHPPKGYLKGMAVAYARMYCKLRAGDAAVTEMAKADTQKPASDVLSWYAPEFQALGFRNDAAGADTLRHLFVLLIGLGMRESSGKHCEGRDMSANNKTGETAEAGLFQTSFNARGANPLMPEIFAAYRANPSGFVDVFHQGVNCTSANLKNWGEGDGVEFQRLSKECPAFAAEFTAVGLRNKRKHWGPINTKKTEVLRDCDTMLRGVQGIVDASADACAALQ